MPLTFTAAHSSRITKPRTKKRPFDRSAAAEFASLARRKPSTPSSGPSGPSGTSGSKATPTAPRNLISAADDDSDDDLFSSRLSDHGLISTLESDLSLRDVVPTMSHCLSSMFDPVPTSRSGMSSTRISEVLRFREALPPIVTNAHVHALVQSPTAVEREIAQLAGKGIVRRLVVPGRGSGAAAYGDALVLTEHWVKMVEGAQGVEDGVREKYVGFLRSPVTDASVLRGVLSDKQITGLMRAGFLTASSAALRASTNVFNTAQPGAQGTATSLSAISRAATSLSAISRAASGSHGAVGGSSAVLDTGGGGGAGGLRAAAAKPPLSLSLPNAGAYLKLLAGARGHLLILLARSKYKEAPLYLLRERWDGSINTKGAYGRSKDPFAEVLPGRTKKWKEFFGVRFDWVLAEAMGAGMVEVFETGSVGLGVRVI